jgi:hypothetical protein
MFAASTAKGLHRMFLEIHGLIGDQQAAALIGRNRAVGRLTARAISTAEADAEVVHG